MKTPVIILSIITLVSTASLHAGEYTFKKPFSQTAPFAANGKINLTNVNGDVTVVTWNKPEILVEGEESAKTEEELNQIEMKIDLAPGTADIVVHLPKKSGGWLGGSTIHAAVKFKLTVPAGATIAKLGVVNSNVLIDGLQGSVTASSVNGNIDAEHLGSDTHLDTVNGYVYASFAEIHAKQNLEFGTVNGPIRVTLPKNAGLKVDTHGNNAPIHCDLPIALQNKSHGTLAGTIGDGRGALEAHTVNGPIHLELAQPTG